jgi:hypothetical protein
MADSFLLIDARVLGKRRRRPCHQANDEAAANALGNARVSKSLRSILKNREGPASEANIQMPVPEITLFAQ